MNPKESNRLRDKIIEILEANCTDNTGTDVRPLYPLLHFFEAELHEYGKHLQGEVLNWKERYDSAVIDGDLLRTRNEELEEVSLEYQNDCQDICDLTSEIFKVMHRETLIEIVGRENWDRFKNHIGV